MHDDDDDDDGSREAKSAVNAPAAVARRRRPSTRGGAWVSRKRRTVEYSKHMMCIRYIYLVFLGPLDSIVFKSKACVVIRLG